MNPRWMISRSLIGFRLTSAQKRPSDSGRDRAGAGMFLAPLQVENRGGAVAGSQPFEPEEGVRLGLLAGIDSCFQQGGLGEPAAQVLQNGDRPGAWREIGEGFLENALRVIG